MTTASSVLNAPVSCSGSELSSVSDENIAPSNKRQSFQARAQPSKRPKLDHGQQKGIYCHHCHSRCAGEDYLRCTRLKLFGKHQPARACNIAWCGKDLSRKYGIHVAATKSSKVTQHDGHDSTKGYKFACPCCTGSCQCAQCRKQKGLESLGNTSAGVNTPRRPKGDIAPTVPVTKATSASQVPKSKKGKAPGPKTTEATRAKQKKNDSSTFPADSDSDLTDPPANPSATPKRSTQSTKASKSARTAPKADAAARKSPGIPVPARIKPVKQKPVRKVIDPPAFEKIDTRLSRTDAENRMGLREFLLRFRSALSIPERNLSVLDDFDRPLTESNVRLFAGALLDPIKDNLTSVDEDLKEDLFNMREELRYYADLVRFASIFNALKEPLELGSLPEVPTSSTEEAKVRALLDLDPSQPTPSWAIEGHARRSASKVPTPGEVVDMLLSLADRAIHTPRLRAEIESSAGESEARRKHASTTKRLHTEWEVAKKKSAEAKVLCRTAAESKRSQMQFSTAQHEHTLRLALANVNLRASQPAIRHESLGTDMDGRTYYVLRSRPIQEDSKPPVGWASGLLVWGPVPATTPTDTLSSDISRWSHFGRSEPTKLLLRWLESKFAMLAMSKPRGWPRQSQVQVVIPQRTRRDAESDSDSALSSVPDDNLLEQLQPVGYAPSIEHVSERGTELCRKLAEVVEWLQVLEWKGLGEVD